MGDLDDTDGCSLGSNGHDLDRNGPGSGGRSTGSRRWGTGSGRWGTGSDWCLGPGYGITNHAVSPLVGDVCNDVLHTISSNEGVGSGYSVAGSSFLGVLVVSVIVSDNHIRWSCCGNSQETGENNCDFHFLLKCYVEEWLSDTITETTSTEGQEAS